jgi:hypothetical protein
MSSLDPQTNTSLYCALCPHSCAHGKDFSVGHPSANRSRPSTLNLEFFSYELPKKKVYLVNMSILSILLSPEPECHTLPPDMKELIKARDSSEKPFILSFC